MAHCASDESEVQSHSTANFVVPTVAIYLGFIHFIIIGFPVLSKTQLILNPDLNYVERAGMIGPDMGLSVFLRRSGILDRHDRNWKQPRRSPEEDKHMVINGEVLYLLVCRRLSNRPPLTDCKSQLLWRSP